MYANDNQKCTCTGPICDCGALGVVKDGAGVRVAAHMMDSAQIADQAVHDKAMAVYDAQLATAGLTHDKYGTPISQLNAQDKARAVDAFKQSNAWMGDRAPKLPAPPALRTDKYGSIDAATDPKERAYREGMHRAGEAWQG